MFRVEVLLRVFSICISETSKSAVFVKYLNILKALFAAVKY